MRIVLEENGLRMLDASEVQQGYFNYFWLRDNCASSWDESTQERTFDVLSLPDDYRPKATEWLNGHLTIEWQDGHNSCYDLAWLKSWVNKGDGVIGHGDLAVRPRKAWLNDFYSDMPKFRYSALMQDPSIVANWSEALLDYGIALVNDVPNSDESLQTLCELIGHVRPSFSGYFFNVETKKNPENLAYTAKALELHTDLPPEELAPGIQFLHCRVNEAEGGNSLFVDATRVCQDFAKRHPEDFKLLCEIEIPFRYTTNHQDVRSRQRVIELDPKNGEVSGIHFSQHLLDIFDLPETLMDAYYQAFRRFGQMLQATKYLMQFRLKTGQCVVFDNHRVVHGRAAFQQGSGDRRLRGCYIDRGELRSKYRVLRKQFPKD